MFEKMLSEQIIILVLFSLGVIAMIFKSNNIMTEVYNLLSKTKLSNRTILYIVSTISGILPVPGRTAVSNVVLDTMQDKNVNNTQWGILSYLATHHYYLWSPIEKSVLISMSVLGITYGTFLKYMIPVIVLYQIVTLVYILKFIPIDSVHFKKSDAINFSKLFDAGLFMAGIMLCVFTSLNLAGMLCGLAIYYAIKYHLSIGEILKNTNWKLLIFVAGVVCLGVMLHSYEASFMDYIKVLQQSHVSIILIVAVCMAFSITMGSSSKFAAISALMTTIFGMQYFVLFYIADFCGYLLSPTHKCVAMAKEYYGTPFKNFYGVVSVMCITLIGQQIIRVMV